MDMIQSETVGQVLSEAARTLNRAGVESARLDARLLLMEALSDGDQIISPIAALTDRDRRLDAETRARFAALLNRRCAREPVSRILGRREFWSLDFKVTPDTLDPRPDSETIVETVLAETPDREAPLRLLDFGTGSGCLILALLSELPNATGLGVDISPAACEVARENARKLGLSTRVDFVVGDWGLEIGGPFNFIVTNPPYIVSEEIDRLTPEVAGFEPRIALSGGADGLASYRALVPGLKSLLTTDGGVVLEIGDGQQDAIASLLRRNGFSRIDYRRDLTARIRCIYARP